jgi:acyl carrier protein
MPRSERKTFLTSYVCSEISKILGLSDIEQLHPRRRLFDLGLDSLMAIELNNRLQQSLGRSLPPTTLFNYPTVEALVKYLTEQILPAELFVNGEEKQPAKTETAAIAYNEVIQLSQTELESLIDGELNKLTK